MRLMFQSAPPCAGGDWTRRYTIVLPRFQSAPPCAGGDAGAVSELRVACCFNPRPPVRGAMDVTASHALPL